MNNLYKELALVYEAMYQTFINYQEEYKLYSEILKRYDKKTVVEIGCGTGNLAKYFVDNQFQYTGIDISENMLQLAKGKTPDVDFIKGDMRDFQLTQPTQSIIITARTISYLLPNQEVQTTFSTIFDNLLTGGVLCFDFIDANQFMPIVAKGEEIIHRAKYQNRSYVRKSQWHLNFDYGMGFKWDSTYYKQVGTELIELGQDNSILRAFTRDEVRIFLKLAGFTVKEMIARATYAFPTYVVVAVKS